MLPNWLYGKSLRKLQEILNSGGQTAAGVSYSNTESGLEATNAQAAIDEVVADLNTKAAQSTVSTLSDTVTTLTGTVNGKVSWSDYAQLGAVNLLPNTATTQTVNGITFTVNSDGSVTVTGTATANAVFILCPASKWKDISKSGSYTLTGCPDGGSGTTYWMQAEFTDDGSVKNFIDYGSGRTNEITDGLIMGSSQNIYIVIANGYAITDSLTFYPMLTLASYTGSYVPYAKTNAELTSDISDLSSNFDTYKSLSGKLVGAFSWNTTDTFTRGGINMNSGGPRILYGGRGSQNSFLIMLAANSGEYVVLADPNSIINSFTWTITNGIGVFQIKFNSVYGSSMNYGIV